jgi:hypothetical protein
MDSQRKYPNIACSKPASGNEAKFGLKMLLFKALCLSQK